MGVDYLATLGQEHVRHPLDLTRAADESGHVALCEHSDRRCYFSNFFFDFDQRPPGKTGLEIFQKARMIGR